MRLSRCPLNFLIPPHAHPHRRPSGRRTWQELLPQQQRRIRSCVPSWMPLQYQRECNSGGELGCFALWLEPAGHPNPSSVAQGRRRGTPTCITTIHSRSRPAAGRLVVAGDDLLEDEDNPWSHSAPQRATQASRQHGVRGCCVLSCACHAEATRGASPALLLLSCWLPTRCTASFCYIAGGEGGAARAVVSRMQAGMACLDRWLQPAWLERCNEMSQGR